MHERVSSSVLILQDADSAVRNCEERMGLLQAEVRTAQQKRAEYTAKVANYEQQISEQEKELQQLSDPVDVAPAPVATALRPVPSIEYESISESESTGVVSKSHSRPLSSIALTVHQAEYEAISDCEGGETPAPPLSILKPPAIEIEPISDVETESANENEDTSKTEGVNKTGDTNVIQDANEMECVNENGGVNDLEGANVLSPNVSSPMEVEPVSDAEEQVVPKKSQFSVVETESVTDVESEADLSGNTGSVVGSASMCDSLSSSEHPLPSSSGPSCSLPSAGPPSSILPSPALGLPPTTSITQPSDTNTPPLGPSPSDTSPPSDPEPSVPATAQHTVLWEHNYSKSHSSVSPVEPKSSPSPSSKECSPDHLAPSTVSDLSQCMEEIVPPSSTTPSGVNNCEQEVSITSGVNTCEQEVSILGVELGEGPEASCVCRRTLPYEKQQSAKKNGKQSKIVSISKGADKKVVTIRRKVKKDAGMVAEKVMVAKGKGVVKNSRTKSVLPHSSLPGLGEALDRAMQEALSPTLATLPDWGACPVDEGVCPPPVPAESLLSPQDTVQPFLNLVVTLLNRQSVSDIIEASSDPSTPDSILALLSPDSDEELDLFFHSCQDYPFTIPADQTPVYAIPQLISQDLALPIESDSISTAALKAVEEGLVSCEPLEEGTDNTGSSDEKLVSARALELNTRALVEEISSTLQEGLGKEVGSTCGSPRHNTEAVSSAVGLGAVKDGSIPAPISTGKPLTAKGQGLMETARRMYASVGDALRVVGHGLVSTAGLAQQDSAAIATTVPPVFPVRGELVSIAVPVSVGDALRVMGQGLVNTSGLGEVSISTSSSPVADGPAIVQGSKVNSATADIRVTKSIVSPILSSGKVLDRDSTNQTTSVATDTQAKDTPVSPRSSVALGLGTRDSSPTVPEPMEVGAMEVMGHSNDDVFIVEPATVSNKRAGAPSRDATPVKKLAPSSKHLAKHAPGKQAGKSPTPAKQPGKVSTPVKQPGKVSTPVKQPGKVSTPVKQPSPPAKQPVPAKPQAKLSTPAKQAGKVSTQAKQPSPPAKQSVPAKPQAKLSTPAKQPGKVSTPVKQPSPPAKQSVPAKPQPAPVKHPGKASALAKQPGKVSTAAKQPAKVPTSTAPAQVGKKPPVAKVAGATKGELKVGNQQLVSSGVAQQPTAGKQGAAGLGSPKVMRTEAKETVTKAAPQVKKAVSQGKKTAPGIATEAKVTPVVKKVSPGSSRASEAKKAAIVTRSSAPEVGKTTIAALETKNAAPEAKRTAPKTALEVKETATEAKKAATEVKKAAPKTALEVKKTATEAKKAATEVKKAAPKTLEVKKTALDVKKPAPEAKKAAAEVKKTAPAPEAKKTAPEARSAVPEAKKVSVEPPSGPDSCARTSGLRSVKKTAPASSSSTGISAQQPCSSGGSDAETNTTVTAKGMIKQILVSRAASTATPLGSKDSVQTGAIGSTEFSPFAFLSAHSVIRTPSLVHTKASIPDKVLKELELMAPSSTSPTSLSPPSPDPEYKEYTSPLLCFSSYRLNPAFRTGDKVCVNSLTFSNKLDPSKILCKFELTGVCSDPKCSAQHIRDAGMSKEELVQDLVSYAPTLAGCTSEELTAEPVQGTEGAAGKVLTYSRGLLERYGEKLSDEELYKLVVHDANAERAKVKTRKEYVHFDDQPWNVGVAEVGPVKPLVSDGAGLGEEGVVSLADIGPEISEVLMSPPTRVDERR